MYICCVCIVDHIMMYTVWEPLYKDTSELRDTSINRILSTVPITTFVNFKTSEMRTSQLAYT